MRPGSNIKTKRFEYTPETAVRNVLFAQVARKTVPNTWSSDSEAPVAECVVCAWNGTRSVGGRA